MSGLYQFDLDSAQRIARVVGRVEGTPPAASPLRLRRAQDPEPRRFRIGTFVGPWPVGTTKSVTPAGGAQTTFNAINLFATVSSGGTRNCAIAKDGTAWYLIAAQC